MNMSVPSHVVAQPRKPAVNSGLRPAVGLAMVSLLVFGLAYSLIATGMGRALFPHAASGSLIERDGRIVGSVLVAQPFADSRYFHPRPSAAGYDVMAVAGSNQARTNPDLQARVAEATAAVAAREGIAPADVPGDLVTQSGGGIDPHVSPEGARVQIARVAAARGLSPATVAQLVNQHTQQRPFGLLGQPRVNVLELNLALDAMSPAGSSN